LVLQNNDMEDELVVLKEFFNETEAHIVKGFLESCGIIAHVLDNGVNLRRFVLGSGISGFARVRLMVSLSDLKEARELLKELPKE